jgi:hypothetical protein
VAKVTNVLNRSVAHLRRPPCRGQCAKKTGKMTLRGRVAPPNLSRSEPSTCPPAAFGISGLAGGSSSGEFANATADDRQIEVIRIE